MLDKYILPNLKNDNYYAAFTAFLKNSEKYFSFARDGTPFDESNDPDVIRSAIITKIIVVGIISLLIALTVCLIWAGRMKTAKIARTANLYIPANGFNLTGRQDRFLYRTVTRTKIERTSGSGGSGRSISSGGGSHRSGKF
jgi:uncharacterized protein